MDIGEQIRKDIDKHWSDTQGDGLRHHLGASVLGRKCAREVWFIFRWIRSVKHTGRILRLFQRGKDEEARVINWLEQIGFRVEDTDPETGKQWRIKTRNPHVGGSGDGKLYPNQMYSLDGEGLLEIKTHGEKSFKVLVEKQVAMAKPEHYVQCQVYMHEMELLWCVYVGVNKNTDDLHIEVIHHKQEVAEYYLDRANQIVWQQEPPPRINESPSWWVCKLCDFSEICHHDGTPDLNCRSCVNAFPTQDGTWYCDRWKNTIPKDFLKEGCGEWEPIA